MAGPKLVSLPFKLSDYTKGILVTQAFGDGNHTGSWDYYSIDFKLPFGAKVLAMLPGKLRAMRESIKDGSSASTGPSDPSLGSSDIGNFATVYDAASGIYITYMHMKQSSVVPSTTNPTVVAGGDIGQVGNTGFRTGTHLHVQFGTTSVAFKPGEVADGTKKSSVPVIFDTATGVILAGVISEYDVDLTNQSGLASNMHNITLFGSANRTGRGDSYDNVISGNRGVNLLNGREGNDTIYGGDGNDLIFGWTGRDALHGGKHADTFAFVTTGDSAVGSSHDTIFDFRSSEGDKIDLSAIDANTLKSGDQGFAYIGSNAFSKKAGELRLDKNLLQGDVNGDGRPDFEIYLPGVSSLKVGDFWL